MSSRYILLFVFGFLNQFIFGQNETLKLPEMAVASPQAFQLTKYGNTVVDESSGRISESINVGQYTAGGITIPINLSYTGGGVKVAQNPTWTGMSWVLNAGGVITRTVRDLPDETPLERRTYSYDSLFQMRQIVAAGEILPNNVVNFIKNSEENDSEADEFNFSFPGYSGSFYLKQNAETGVFTPVLTKYESELKIEILGSFTAPAGFTDYGTAASSNPNYWFKITTTDGTMYHFGGSVVPTEISEVGYAVEETQLIDRSTALTKQSCRVKTAFYLNKIENGMGDAMYFTYHTKPKYEVFFANDHMKSIVVAAGSGCMTGSPSIPNSTLMRIIRNTVYNGKFLKKIHSYQNPGVVVEFNSTEVMEPMEGHGGMGAVNLKYRVLTNIDLGYKNVNLTYFPALSTLTSGNKDKFFLTKVEFKDAENVNRSEKYEMEYDNLSGVPSKTSNGQDYLGYYNGRSNPSLLPKKGAALLYAFLSGGTMYDYLINAGSTSNLINLADFATFNSSLGDREPYFEFAQRGILKKITYPTGGFTMFEYEPVEKKQVPETLNFSIHHNPSNPVNTVLEQTKHILGFNLVEMGMPLSPTNTPTQDVLVTLNIGTIQPVSQLALRDFVYFKVIDITNVNNPNIVTEKRIHVPAAATQFEPENPSSSSMSFVFKYHKGHTYEFKIGFGYNIGNQYITNQNNNLHFLDNIVGSASFQYLTAAFSNDGLGIRIKRVKDYSNPTTTPLIKRYYYGKIDDLNDGHKNSKLKIFNPLFHSFYAEMKYCDENPDLNILAYNYLLYYMSLHSNTLSLGSPSMDTPAVYKNVTISYGGDNFENGGVEKTFHIDEDQSQVDFKLASIDFQPPGSMSGTTFVNEEFDALMFSFLEFRNTPKTNYGLNNGIVVKETYWEKKDLQLYKVRQIEYEYNYFRNESIPGLSIQQQYPCTLCYSHAFRNFYVGTYKTYSFKPFLIKKTQHDYIDKIGLFSYSELYPMGHGWGLGDDDGDGIINMFDDTPTPSVGEFEEGFKKITTVNNYFYNPTFLAGMPRSITTTNSDGTSSEVKNYYPIPYYTSLLTDLLPEELNAYNNLVAKNRIGNPIQTETYNGTEKLSTSRDIYKLQPLDVGSSTIIEVKDKVKIAKGSQPLENGIIYHKYDAKGNPVEISLPNGTSVVYIWNTKRQPILKIVNASYDEWIAATGSSVPPSGDGDEVLDFDFTTPPTVNPFSVLLPNAQFTIYNYNNSTNLLTSTMDTKGDITTYHYDIFNQLQYIKDKLGNILQEYKSNYKSE